MSFQEVEYANSVFFKSYKIIENIHSIVSWFCICYQYSGCQPMQKFLKCLKR